MMREIAELHIRVRAERRDHAFCDPAFKSDTFQQIEDLRVKAFEEKLQELMMPGSNSHYIFDSKKFEPPIDVELHGVVLKGFVCLMGVEGRGNDGLIRLSYMREIDV